MAYEKGGRADKFGNRYEYRWIVEQLIRLSNERIVSLIHEPVGPNEDGIDLQIFNSDGSIELHQCKGRNGNEDNWSLADLNGREIFASRQKPFGFQQG